LSALKEFGGNFTIVFLPSFLKVNAPLPLKDFSNELLLKSL